jgi:hypothetical protein
MRTDQTFDGQCTAGPQPGKRGANIAWPTVGFEISALPMSGLRQILQSEGDVEQTS